ncbi:MAG TPA: hypothetical protein VIK27_08290 [Candidatus Aquilonibacter sp.]
MTQSARDWENTFAHAWTLLVRNPVIVIPCLATGVIAAGVQFFVGVVVMGSVAVSGDGSRGALEAIETLTEIVLFVITLALSLMQMAYVTGMAGAAWRHGRTSLRDGWAALGHRMWPLLAAAALLLVIGICAATLASVTFLVTLLAYAVFFIYTMAAVVIGERPPIAAIIQSANIALANFLPTLGIVLLIAVIALLGGWLGSLAGRVSDIGGWLVAGLLQQIIVAYASLVVAGEYLALASPPPQAGS